MPALVEQNQTGKREDLLNLMTVADAAEKPFMAMVPKGKKPTNMEYSYLVDKYDDVSLEILSFWAENDLKRSDVKIDVPNLSKTSLSKEGDTILTDSKNPPKLTQTVDGLALPFPFPVSYAWR